MGSSPIALTKNHCYTMISCTERTVVTDRLFRVGTVSAKTRTARILAAVAADAFFWLAMWGYGSGGYYSTSVRDAPRRRDHLRRPYGQARCARGRLRQMRAQVSLYDCAL